MKIAIAAVGARTAVGYTAAQSAAAVRVDIANFNEHPSWVDQRGEPMVLAAAPEPPPGQDPGERLLYLLDAALTDLESSLPGPLGSPPLVVALPANRPGLEPDLAHRVAAALTARHTDRLRLARCESFTLGQAGGLTAVIHGAELVRRGNPLVVVAAADSWLQIDTLEWLDRRGRLHALDMPWGFVPGEAGGCCLLADQQALERLGLPCLGVIEGVGTGSEPHPLGSDVPCVGTGLTEALQATLAGIPKHGVDAIYCDLNGERHRADEAGFALARIGESLRDPDAILVPATCWGQGNRMIIPAETRCWRGSEPSRLGKGPGMARAQHRCWARPPSLAGFAQPTFVGGALRAPKPTQATLTDRSGSRSDA